MEKCTYVYHIVFGIVRIGAANVQAASILHWLNDANVVSAFENLKNQFELYVIQRAILWSGWSGEIWVIVADWDEKAKLCEPQAEKSIGW